MKFFLLSLIIISQATFAGERGNGGDVIVCRTSKGDIESIEMLDLYEARELHGLALDPSLSAENTLEQNLFSLIDGIRWVGAPVRAHSYKKLADAFFAEAEISHFGGLPDIPDHGDISLPENCSLEQVAIQELYPIDRSQKRGCDDFFKEKPRYKIEKSLWDKMDTVNRAALIMHEIIYRDFLIGNAYFGRETKNSSSARYLVGIIFTFKKRWDLAGNEFRDWLKKNLFFIQEFQGHALLSNSTNKFYPDGSLQEGEANPYIPSFINFGRRMQDPSWHQIQYRFELNESGSPKKIYACSSIPITNQLSDWEARQFYPVTSYGEALYGDLAIAWFEKPVPGKILGQDVRINFLSRNESGMSINLADAFQLRHQNYELLVPAEKSMSAFKSFVDSGFELKELRPYHINGTGRVFCASRNKWIKVIPEDAVFFTEKNKIKTIVSREVIRCEE